MHCKRDLHETVIMGLSEFGFLRLLAHLLILWREDHSFLINLGWKSERQA